MKIGLTTKFKLLSLLPILITLLFAIYFTYTSVLDYINLDAQGRGNLISVILSVLLLLVSSAMIYFSLELSKTNAKNLQSLRVILDKVTNNSNRPRHANAEINLESSSGLHDAYQLIENLIKQIEEDKILAQEASEAKSMFLANMSHEIRTPLNGIVGFTELLRDSGLDEEQVEFIDIIEKSSENLLQIINNILDLSKIESNKLDIEDIIFQPIREFESAVEVYAVRASEKHIDLGCYIDPALNQSLKGDPTKLKEIIINLLSNAVKFTSSSGSINVNIQKLPSQEAGRTRIKFEVQDSGIGVTSEQKERIFEAFSQADTSITRKYGGTGLGLTITSRFIEIMGGDLDLHSEQGKGTTFFFTLDFEEVEIVKDNFNLEDFQDLNALILEDKHNKKPQASFLRKYLDYFGVNYKVFYSSEEFKALKSQSKYSLLLVDYDYCSEDDIIEYSKEDLALALLTKATYMKKLDSLDIEIFKILYEPLNSTKIKALLDSYLSQSIDGVIQKKQLKKKQAQKKFNAETSKFQANVLIAEDNIINQKLIKRTLEDIGLTITLASNGLEAFQKRKDGDFDLIFMDIQMPFLDGIESTKEILEYEEDYKQKHIPIIALTANALKGDREKFLASGLDEYTTKPLVRSEIITLLNNFLADHIIESDFTENSPQELQETLNIQEPETIVQEELIVVPNLYNEEVENTTDILLAKRSSFESKLLTRLLDSLGYTYNVAYSQEEIDSFLTTNIYKTILFDKVCLEVTIEELSNKVQEQNTDSDITTSLILMDNASEEENTDDSIHVQEVIKSVVNKDLLEKIFQKYI